MTIGRMRSMISSVRLNPACSISFMTHSDWSELLEMNKTNMSEVASSLNISVNVCLPASKDISSMTQFLFPKTLATRLTRSLSLLLWDRNAFAMMGKLRFC